jgi:sugar phosphate isomerase/epimerase
MKLAALSTTLSPDVRTALRGARRLELPAIELWVVDNELEPARLPRSARLELMAALAKAGLECPALCADFGGFTDPAAVDTRVGKTKAAVELAREINVPIVTGHAGRVPGDPQSRAYHALLDALRDVAEFAAGRDVLYAVLTGPDSPERFARFIGDVPAAQVAFDPAVLCMHGHDPLDALARLKHRVVHVHARDAAADSALDGIGREARLGEGGARLRECLALLREANYGGCLSIASQAPASEADLLHALNYLKKHSL